MSGTGLARRLVFDELQGRAKEKLAKEEKQRKRAKQEFASLLRDSKTIRYDTTWDAALAELEKAPEFKAVRS